MRPETKTLQDNLAAVFREVENSPNIPRGEKDVIQDLVVKSLWMNGASEALILSQSDLLTGPEILARAKDLGHECQAIINSIKRIVAARRSQ